MTLGTQSVTLRLLLPVLYLGLFALLYATDFQVMVKQWGNADYTYCYLVPFVAGYLFWERQWALRLPSAPSWVGVGWIGLGVFLYFLGQLGGEFYTIYFSSWVLLVGLLWLHFGWHKLRGLAFPVCFLLAMFPFPNMVNSSLSMHLKLISSKIGVVLLQVFGVSVFQEGNIIDLGFTKLEVVEACSGLRYLFPLLIVGVLLAAHQQARWWQRVLVVLPAVPFSIMVNSVRITLIAWLYPVLGESVVDGFWHDAMGWGLFMASVGGMLAVRWLVLLMAPPRVEEQRIGEERQERLVSPARPKAVWPMALAAVLLLGVTAGLTRGIEFREQLLLTRPLAEFPLTLGPWQGSRSSLEQKYLDALKLSDHLLADYRNEQGQVVSLYVAYNASQRKGQSSHSPATCLPGSGWVFKESGTARLPVGGAGSEAVVKRAFMEKNGERLLGYYWFPQRGRVLTNLVQLKWFTFWDALTRQRTDGALVRVLTTVQAGEQPAQAEARLQEFIRLAGPELNTFLPGR